jgi:hypothetical protein
LVIPVRIQCIKNIAAANPVSDINYLIAIPQPNVVLINPNYHATPSQCQTDFAFTLIPLDESNVPAFLTEVGLG